MKILFLLSTIFLCQFFIYSLEYNVVFFKSKVDDLSVRSSSNLNSEIVYKLRKDEHVKFIKNGQNENIDNIDGFWIQVSSNGQKGWCFSGYLEKVVYKISISDKDIEYLTLNYNKEKNEGFYNFFSYKNEYLWQTSPNNKYIIICSKYSWKHPDKTDEVNNKCWMLIYEISTKNLVYKDTGFIIFGTLRWLENINYLLDDKGSYIPRYYLFYNLKTSKQDFYFQDVIAKFTNNNFNISKSLYYSDDLRYFAVYYWPKFDDSQPLEKLLVKIKVYDTIEEKYYIFDYKKDKSLIDYVKNIKK